MMRFIYGRSYALKEKEMVKRMGELLASNHNKIYYLVPDHLKFQSELNVLQSLQDEFFPDKKYVGMIQLQVLSFNRLAWYLMQDQEIFNRPQLSQASLSMLLQKILIDQQDQLKVFRTEIQKQGFILKLIDLFTEFRQGQLEVEQLHHLVDQLGQDPLEQSMADKINDLSIIYEQFEKALEGHFVQNEDIIDQLMTYINQHNFSNSSIFINHFSQFTAKEEQLILTLAENCKQVTIALPFDQADGVQFPEQDDVFYPSKKTFSRLFHAGRQLGLDVGYSQAIEQNFDSVQALFKQAESLMLDTPIERIRREKNEVSQPAAVELWQATSKQAEVFHLFSEIRQLVVADHYKYKDMIILCRQIENYQSIIQPYFERNAIPLFIDHSKSMADHAFAHFISSLLDMDQYGFRLEDVMNFLRSDLSIHLSSEDLSYLQANKGEAIAVLSRSHRQLVDRAENYFLRFGIDRHELYQEQEYGWVQDDLNEDLVEEQKAANCIRTFLRKQILPFFQKLKQAATFKEGFQSIYRFIEEYHLPDLLLAWRDYDLDGGQLESAREYEEIWQCFIDLLDESVEILAEEEWNLSLFRELIETAFDQASYSNVPPAIDQIILTDFNRLPALKNKVVFIIGLDQDCLPLQTANRSLLTDEEREEIDQTTPDHVYLLKDNQKQIYNERLLAYQLMTQATDRLYLTYTCFDDENKEIKPSIYFDRWLDSFNLKLQQKTLNTEILFTQSGLELINYTPTQQEGRGQLLAILSYALQNKKTPTAFWMAIWSYFNSADQSAIFKKLIQSLTYTNRPAQLKEELAEALYGKNLNLSVSQIESFYRDPYSYFLKYGLRLEERPILQLNPLEKGNFLHAGMDQLIKLVKEYNVALNQLTSQQVDSLIKQVIQKLSQQSEFIIFSKSNRMAYRKNQLQAVMKEMFQSLIFQAQTMNIETQASEIQFGRLHSSASESIKGLYYPLESDRSIQVRGKIDRLDLLGTDQSRWFNVVDYKSSKHKINFTDFYYGLAIQLLTYLRVVEENMKDNKRSIDVGGAFYSQLKNPYIKIEQALPSGQLADFITDQKQNEFVLEGLIVESPDLIDFLNDHIKEQESSKVFNLKRNKNGDYAASSRKNMVSREELNQLYLYLDHLIIQAGKRILSGDTRLAPFEDEYYTLSIQGPYRSISQFDAKLKENTYRPKTKKELEDIIDLNQKED